MVRLPAWIYDLPFRCGIAVAVLVVTIGGALAYTATRPHLYEASARIWVQAKLPSEIPGQQGNAVFAPLTYFFNSPITTAAEVMNSSVVLTEATRLFRERFPDLQTPTVNEIRTALKVQPVKDADIIIFSYRDGQAKRAYAIVASVLDAFIHVNSTQASSSAVQSRIFLERQLEAAKAKYADARHKVKEFQEQNKAVDLPAQTSALLVQTAELRKQIDEARATATEERAKIIELTSQLNARPQEGETSSEADDAILETLEKKLADDEVRLVELRSRLLESHPRVERLKSSIEKTRKLIHDRLRTARKHAGSESVAATGVRLREKLLGDLSEARSNESAANNRVILLVKTLEKVNSKIETLPEQQKKLSEITRAESVSVEALNNIERGLHSARLLESVASETSNIQVIDRPELPERATAASLVRNVAVGSAFGFLLAGSLFFGLMYTDPYIRKYQHIKAYLDLPVLGWVGGKGLDQTLRQIHGVRFSIRNWLKSSSNRIVLLSQLPGEGKTAIAAALAKSFAQSGIRTLLVDCHLGNPGLSALLNVSPSVGISDVMSNTNTLAAEELSSTIRELTPHLFFLDAGTRSEQNDVSLMKSALLRIATQYQVVIFDTPPLSDSAGALALLDSESNVILATGLAHATKQSLQLLAAQFKQQSTGYSGIVLTHATEADFAGTLAPKSTELTPEPTAVW